MDAADDDASNQAAAGAKPGATSDSSEADARQGSVGDIHAYIGARLRQAYDNVAKQPVPDRFLQLMRELDRS